MGIKRRQLERREVRPSPGAARPARATGVVSFPSGGERQVRFLRNQPSVSARALGATPIQAASGNKHGAAGNDGEKQLLRGRPKSVASQAPELGECEIDIAPFYYSVDI